MTLADLQSAYHAVAAELDLRVEEVAAVLGVNLCEPQPGLTSGYTETPLNSTLFAWLGADGCHWVFLDCAGPPDMHERPVIAVSPEEADQSCVGESLREFIELECQSLEHFMHHGPAQSSFDNQASDSQAARDKRLRIIAALRAALHLRARPDLIHRLGELRHRYRDDMRFSE